MQVVMSLPPSQQSDEQVSRILHELLRSHWGHTAFRYVCDGPQIPTERTACRSCRAPVPDGGVTRCWSKPLYVPNLLDVGDFSVGTMAPQNRHLPVVLTSSSRPRRSLQVEAVTATLNKRDVLLILPTGGGKSITFQLPPLFLQGVTVVVCPLLALARDQVRESG